MIFRFFFNFQGLLDFKRLLWSSLWQNYPETLQCQPEILSFSTTSSWTRDAASTRGQACSLPQLAASTRYRHPSSPRTGRWEPPSTETVNLSPTYLDVLSTGTEQWLPPRATFSWMMATGCGSSGWGIIMDWSGTCDPSSLVTYWAKQLHNKASLFRKVFNSKCFEQHF